MLVAIGMRAAVLAFTLVAAVSGRAAGANNDGGASPFESRPTVIYAVLGAGAPLGLVGVELEETVLPNWSLSAGFGWGAANAPQGAAMIHWQGGGAYTRVMLGAGISGGGYQWKEFCLDACANGPVTKSGAVAWGNFELGVERRFSGGFVIRNFLGYGHVIAGNLTCDQPANICGPYYQNDGYSLIYIGGALGYSF